MIIIDTSYWIEFFRNRDPWASSVADLIESDDAVLIGPVYTEILRGIVRSSVRSKIEELLHGITFLNQPTNLWQRAGDIGYQITKKGYTTKTLDLLIATHAISADIPILSKDNDFKVMKRAGLPLRLID